MNFTDKPAPATTATEERSPDQYAFTTHWRVQASLEEVWYVITDGDRLADWWPAVYQQVNLQDSGDRHGMGRRLQVKTRGWLPYTLDWNMTVTEKESPVRLGVRASGDLQGTGLWTLEQDGDHVTLTYDWLIHLNHPILRLFSPLLKPIFAWNHRWAMRKGEESLRLELQRRQVRSLEEGLRIPRPPRPAPSGPLMVGAAVIGMGLWVWARQRSAH
jgi:carbon monoxide dehydrogenase subunit G